MGQGYKYMFIMNIITNIVILVIVVVFIDRYINEDRLATSGNLRGTYSREEYLTEVKTFKNAIIMAAVIKYVGLALIYGAIGWYWWTVVRDWTELANN